MGASTTINSDHDLVRKAHAGDADALRTLLDEHLHPAWRMALVSAPDAPAAEAAVVAGVCDGLKAALRSPDPTQSLRVRLVAATRRAATVRPATTVAAGPTDPVLAAFRAMPERSRAALWLVEVEGGTPEQIAPVLGLSRSEAAALADRSTSSFRNRLAADIAARAEQPECRQALGSLPAHAAGRLTEAEQAGVSDHLSSCGACTLWLAAVVAPRPALRKAAIAIPAGLALAVTERWTEVVAAERRVGLAPWTERAIGTAAAAVIAVGLAGIALVGRDRGPSTPMLVAPSGVDGGSTGESAAALAPEAVAENLGSISTGQGTAAAVATGNSGGNTRRAASTSATPAADATPGAPSASSPPAPSTPPPATGPGPTVPVPPPPAILPEGSQASIDVGGSGGVAVDIGDCTGISVIGIVVGCTTASEGPAEVAIALPVPGVPPIKLP